MFIGNALLRDAKRSSGGLTMQINRSIAVSGQPSWVIEFLSVV
ncbi:MAG: hypothetical protein ACLP9L_02460 [Thermoguttaceae bacterium]